MHLNVACGPLRILCRMGAEHANVTNRMVQGYNVRHWSAGGLDFWAVSDLDPTELNEFVQKISTAFRGGPS